MNLEDAATKHGEWKAKFRAAIKANATMDAASIAKDNCCDLGRWLHGEGKETLKQFPGYASCLARHAEFHVEARKVATAINAKKFLEAEAMFAAGTPYMAASHAVTKAIIALKAGARM